MHSPRRKRKARYFLDAAVRKADNGPRYFHASASLEVQVSNSVHAQGLLKCHEHLFGA
jgi:hypothetical protein